MLYFNIWCALVICSYVNLHINPTHAVSTQSSNLFAQVGVLLNGYCFLIWEAYKLHSEPGSLFYGVGSKLQVGHAHSRVFLFRFYVSIIISDLQGPLITFLQPKNVILFCPWACLLYADQYLILLAVRAPRRRAPYSSDPPHFVFWEKR